MVSVSWLHWARSYALIRPLLPWPLKSQLLHSLEQVSTTRPQAERRAPGERDWAAARQKRNVRERGGAAARIRLRHKTAWRHIKASAQFTTQTRMQRPQKSVPGLCEGEALRDVPASSLTCGTGQQRPRGPCVKTYVDRETMHDYQDQVRLSAACRRVCTNLPPRYHLAVF